MSDFIRSYSVRLRRHQLSCIDCDRTNKQKSQINNNPSNKLLTFSSIKHRLKIFIKKCFLVLISSWFYLDCILNGWNLSKLLPACFCVCVKLLLYRGEERRTAHGSPQAEEEENNHHKCICFVWTFCVRYWMVHGP